ncbi:hypothetical protein BGX24_010011, partial [Mortierella sp. AD032]
MKISTTIILSAVAAIVCAHHQEPAAAVAAKTQSHNSQLYNSERLSKRELPVVGDLLGNLPVVGSDAGGSSLLKKREPGLPIVGDLLGNLPVVGSVA